mmetsp:Transcript_17403/g.27644  ORF Transcript_17403/g.27644 Transcript_17403/m.27644 type:complete len:151 (-) Transcript_17403:657-1109(-)
MGMCCGDWGWQVCGPGIVEYSPHLHTFYPFCFNDTCGPKRNRDLWAATMLGVICNARTMVEANEGTRENMPYSHFPHMFDHWLTAPIPQEGCGVRGSAYVMYVRVKRDAPDWLGLFRLKWSCFFLKHPHRPCPPFPSVDLGDIQSIRTDH